MVTKIAFIRNFREGAYYDGNWEEGQRHGKGKMFFADKSGKD